MEGMAIIPVLLEGSTRHEVLNEILEVIEYVAVVIEPLAVTIIVIAIVYATYNFLVRRMHRDDPRINYRLYRAQLGSGLLLGLEVLVAADVIRTVALKPTIESVAVLGMLVLIRIVLGWSIVVEIEHRWPWQEPIEEEA
jgi:uncharacterized membrane protein